MKNQTHPSKSKLGLKLCAALALNLLSLSVWAEGTASGTSISNIAKLTYTVGADNVVQNPICSSPTGNTTQTTGSTCTDGTDGAGNTSFVVDNKVNLTVTEVSGSYTTVVPGATKQVTTFSVNNLGNTVQDYSLALNSALSGVTLFSKTDNFDPSACVIAVESGGTAGYDTADTATYIDELAADASKTVYVACTIPTAQLNTDHAVVELTATTAAGGTAGSKGSDVAASSANTAGVDIVFADAVTTANTSGTIPAQTASDGKAFARDGYEVVSAVLKVSKAVAVVCDPINGNSSPKNIPGALVQYAITIENTGSADAKLTKLADVLNSNMTWNSKLNAGSAPVANVDSTCKDGTDSSLSSTGFAASIGSYTAPGTAAQAMSAGGSNSGQNLEIDFSTLATSGITAPAAATLAPNGKITVYFNAVIK